MNIKNLHEKVFAIDLIFLSAIEKSFFRKRIGWFQSPSTTQIENKRFVAEIKSLNN